MCGDHLAHGFTISAGDCRCKSLRQAIDQIDSGLQRCQRTLVFPNRSWPTKPFHPSTRAALRKRRIRFTGPERSNQKSCRNAKGGNGGRRPAVNAGEYARRNVVERCFHRLKQFGDLATRYAQRAVY